MESYHNPIPGARRAGEEKGGHTGKLQRNGVKHNEMRGGVEGKVR